MSSNRGLKAAQRTFKKTMETFIEVNKRDNRKSPVILRLEDIHADCPNCLNDIIFNQEESTNKYNLDFIRPVNIFVGTSEEYTVYPKPFNIDFTPSGIVFDPSNLNPKVIKSTICPVCKGKGKLSITPEVCIVANFNWHPRSAITDGKIIDYSGGRSAANLGILKTKLCNFSVLSRTKEVLLEDGVICELVTDPVKKGVGLDAHLEVILQKVDSTSLTSRVNIEDDRLNIRSTASSSDQATSGTPNTPPNIFSNEDW